MARNFGIPRLADPVRRNNMICLMIPVVTVMVIAFLWLIQ